MFEVYRTAGQIGQRPASMLPQLCSCPPSGKPMNTLQPISSIPVSSSAILFSHRIRAPVAGSPAAFLLGTLQMREMCDNHTLSNIVLGGIVRCTPGRKSGAIHGKSTVHNDHVLCAERSYLLLQYVKIQKVYALDYSRRTVM